MTIGIVSVGIGNLGSVHHALYRNGWDSVFVRGPDDLQGLTHLVLPGVGAYSAAMQRLNDAGLVDPIRKLAEDGLPILGICLGMQLLASEGTEGGITEGLGLIPGRVVPIVPHEGQRLPHTGWNEMHQLRKHPVLSGIRDNADFYFVHSYRFEPSEPDAALGTTEDGADFVSAVGRGNVVGFQFHPEKSQINGLRLLDNFCAWDGTC